MSLGEDSEKQETIFVSYDKVRSEGHVFYDELDRMLRKYGVDAFAQGLCRPFYDAVKGRRSIRPGVYFRCLLIGYFEGIDSERGIAWRVADSLSLRRFLRISLEERTPDHSTLSRTRRRLSGEVHEQVFTWVLKVLCEEGLLKGKTLGVDATTLEANAALRSIVRRDDGRAYDEFLTALAQAEGIEEPTREEKARLDRKRPKKGSNKEWVHPQEPDAQISKMKDGSTHLAHKVEHSVDLETEAIVSVTFHGGVEGDTKTVQKTLGEAADNLADVRQKVSPKAPESLSPQIKEVVADKGYHSNQVLCELEEVEIRSYIPEPKRRRRRWKDKHTERDAVYQNRKRMARNKGKQLQKLRCERNERSFAHTLETGGLRRIHLRRHENIRKRYLIHTAGFNLGLVMRKHLGVGKPRALQGAAALLLHVLVVILRPMRPARLLHTRSRQPRPILAVPGGRAGNFFCRLLPSICSALLRA